MGTVGETSRRNVEGAFPLLLIGGALLVYAVILAQQELGAHSSHLPLYGLVGGVGAVIAGAGIFSALSVEPETALPRVPEAVAPLARRGRGAPNATSRAYRKNAVPIWWEGPEGSPSAAPVPSTVGIAPPAPRAASMRPGGSVAVPSLPSGADLGPNRKWNNAELTELVAEIEAMVREHNSRFPARPARPMPKGVPACCDCHASMAADPSPSCCSDCGRGLCVDCALASSLEDGDLRCLECRERASTDAAIAS